LVELLTVVLVLGMMTLLILPTFDNAESDSKTDIATAELRLIQKAFLNFYYDVNASDAELEKFFNETGFWVFYAAAGGTAPNDLTFTAYDPQYQRGWRGPYLENEGTAAVPTVKDPWGNSYLFLDPAVFDKEDVLLISTGPDGVAQTSAGDTVASGDDIMLKLFL